MDRFFLKFVMIYVALMSATAAYSRRENSQDSRLNYQEESSFGSLNPDEPAKPARQEAYPRRDQPPADTQPERELPQSEERQRPKYRDYFDQFQKRDRSYGDEESVAVSLGVGFGFRTFSGNLGLTVPINRYVAWGLSGSYMSRAEDEEAEVTSSGGLDLILKIPNPTPVTPFVSAGPGYEAWRRSKDEGRGDGLKVFDDDNSPSGNWAVGGSLRLARYVALVGALKSTTYLDLPPRVFADDHAKRELRTHERFELGFAFIF